MAEDSRGLTAHAIIALSIVGAAQMLFVSPARESVEEAQRGIAALRASGGADRDPTGRVTELEQREEAAHRGIADLELANSHADPSKLVDLVQRLGDETQVVINRVDPKTVDPRSTLRTDDKRKNAMPTSGVSLTIEARGGYANVARFIAALEGRPGFVRTEEVNLRPSLTPGKDDVALTVRTTQLAFAPEAFAPKAEDGSVLQ